MEPIIYKENNWNPSRIFRVSFRVVALVLFCYTSLQISWRSLVSLAIFVSTYYCSFWWSAFSSDHLENDSITNSKSKSPPLEKIDYSLNALSGDKKCEVFDKFLTWQLDNSDPTQMECLKHFQPIKSQSNCIFARQSRLWGAPMWNDASSIEENSARILPILLVFTEVCDVLKLDGLVVPVGSKLSASYDIFQEASHALLTSISNRDPSGRNSMRHNGILARNSNWKFEFNRIGFFISGFAGFYDKSDSRFCFNTPSDADLTESEQIGYLLFQPDTSFAHHDLPPNQRYTNWEKPQTVRDRIRIAFRKAGRNYHIDGPVPPGTINMLNDVVRKPRILEEDNNA